MKEWSCEEVLVLLPEIARDSGEPQASGVAEHLATCESCSEEWEIVRLLAQTGPTPVPATLEARVKAAVRADAQAARGRGRWSVPAWRLAAAAGIVLAVATPVLVDRMSDRSVGAVDEVEVAVALGDRLPSPWLDDEVGIVAGAPVLDALSDEALEQLLEEMGG